MSLKDASRALDARLPFDLKGARDRSMAGVREGTATVVLSSGLPRLARRIRAESRAGILLYHNPTPETLERHLQYIAERHAFVTYDAVATAARTGDWSELPPKAIAVTLDDGHAANAGLIRVFRHFGVVPTIFLCTSLVNTHRRFWWTVDGLTRKERDRLMDVPDEERLAVLHDLSGWKPTLEYQDAPAQALSREQIEALGPEVDFQAHTRSHPILPRCHEAQAWDEIAGSRTDVEAVTGLPCRHFAYPNGRYGRREIELLRRAGFMSARTVETGWNDPSVDPFRLRVLGIPDDASLGLLSAQTTGLPGLRRLMYVS